MEDESDNEEHKSINTQFDELIRWYPKLNWITDRIMKLPSDEAINLVLSDGRKILLNQNIAKHLRSLYEAQFNNLRLECTQKRKINRNIQTNDSLTRPFYISDQMKNYLKHSNLGSGVAFGFVYYPLLSVEEKLALMKTENVENFIKENMTTFLTSINQFEKEFAKSHDIEPIIYNEDNIMEFVDIKKNLSLILEENIIPGRLPIVLLNMINDIGGLITKSKRRKPSVVMEKYLNDKKMRLQYVLHGNVLNYDESRDRDFFEMFRTTDKKGNIRFVFKHGNSEDYGFCSSETMVYSNLFRIPYNYYTDEMKNKLETVTNDVKILEKYVFRLKESYKQIEKLT